MQLQICELEKPARGKEQRGKGIEGESFINAWGTIRVERGGVEYAII